MNTIQNVGKNFSRDLYLMARKKTIQLVHNVRDQIAPGMTESEALKIYQQELINLNAQKTWHPPKIRFGKNTLCSFREVSDPAVILQENDICFFDFGPVFDGHEGDFGETYVFGNNEEHHQITKAVKEVFLEVESYWKKTNAIGKVLYQFATEVSAQMGYVLNLKMNGHRLSDWPHAIHYKGSLADVDETPKSDLWVLEILIRHSTNNFGAFYEDIMQLK